MRRWTKEQIKMLTTERVRKSDGELCSLIGKSANAIRIMACRMGIKKLKMREDIELSNEEEQVILGTLMGDGYCRIKKTSKHAILEGAHCRRQEAYLIWKVNKLSSLLFNLRRTKTNYLFFESKTFPCLDYYQDIFYKTGKKRVNKEILEKIKSLGLAVWYMDDGSYGKRNHDSAIYTNGFTYEENEIIKKWFENKWGIYPKIYSVKKENREIKYYTHFNVKATRKLIEIIKPYIHPSMNYKIGECEIKKEVNK